MRKLYFNAMLSDNKTCLPFEVLSFTYDTEVNKLLVLARRMNVTVAERAHGHKCPTVLYEPNEDIESKIFSMMLDDFDERLIDDIKTLQSSVFYADYETFDKKTRCVAQHTTAAFITAYPTLSRDLATSITSYLW